MSTVFSKNKEKRPRTSSNEANNSFVKNVTSRVSGLLPSTITKWFSSPSSSNANGSAQMIDATDSSTEDEASETPVITQPPAKRMRFSTPGTYNHFGPSDAHCSTSNVEMAEVPYSPFSGSHFSQPSRNTFPSSFRPLNEDLAKEMNDRDMHLFRTQHTVAGIGQSIANKRRSIFEANNQEDASNACAKSTTNTIREPKQPNFKPSLLGSPFYPGRTMYGGAASSYINQPNIKQQTVAVVNESKTNEDTAMSSSTRRIMDLLESYSSPLSEARRIPVYTRPKNDKFTSPTNKTYSYKTQELYVPNIASILRLKKKSRLMDTTNAARQIIASHSSASKYPSYPTASQGKEPEKEQPHKFTTKVKTKITRINRGQQPDELDMATPVKLPTAVLQIDQDKLPTFSFGTPVVSKLPATSTPKAIISTADKNITEVPTSKDETVASSVFKFAYPVKVSSDNPEADVTPKFTFGSPEQRIDKKFESNSDEFSVVVGQFKDSEKLTSQSKDWQCSDCWVKNKPDVNKCVCCGSKQPSQNTKCSICKLADSQSLKDKCVNCEKLQLLQGASPLTATSIGICQLAKWQCEDCWVSNDDNAAKCACCGGSRPNNSGKTPVTATVTLQPATVSSNVDADWKCNDCWISNKSSVDKCAACGGAKPGAKPSSSTPAPPTKTGFFGSIDNTFKNIVKSQKSDKWECSSCLVRNDSDITKCSCCGAEKENKNKMPESKFNFGTTPNLFKFGIVPTAPEAVTTPVLQSTLESKFKEPSETNNNVLAQTPSFSFALPTKKIETKTDTTTTGSEEAPKMNFSFGIPKPIAIAAVVPNKLPESSKIEEEKNQEVPSVDLSSLQDKPKQPGDMFMALTRKVSENNTSTTSSGLTLMTPLVVDGKKDTISNSMQLPAVATAETPKPTFTFGVKPNTNLFETPATTATPMNLFTQPSQTIALPTTSAPAASLFNPPETSTSTLFQQPNPNVAIPARLFQTSETNSTAASGPVFSFGSNASSNPKPAAAPASAPEKPKFQFTFGGNTNPITEPPALFKSPFGSTDNNASSTNTFALPQGNTLGSSNPMATNTIGGSNGLSATNGLAGNTMGTLTGNGITGNPLMGNSFTGGNSGNAANSLGGANGLSINPLAGGNSMTGVATGLFGNAMQKENMWSATNNSPTPNMFVSNTATSSPQKPATFTFGSSTPFNSTPAFGNNPAPTQNLFGMGNQNINNQSMFSNSVPSQPAGNLFGSPQPPNNPAPQMGMFGNPNIGAAPTFGSPNPSIPAFEVPSLTPAPAPAFNFGAPQSTGIFGFGQQPQLQQTQQQLQQQLQQQQLQLPQQTGVYSFGGAPAGAPHVQFTVGSGANTAVRRVRKAVRRNPQR